MSGARLLAAVLDPDVAGHLAVALHRHREELAKAGRARPPGLANLEASALEVATGGHEPPGPVPRRMRENPGLRAQEWLSPKDVAAVTGLSPRTVGRHIGSGALRSTKAGARRLIARSDLDDFFNRRRSDTDEEKA